MEQSGVTSTPGAAEDQDPAFVALVRAIERLDELGLADEDGRAVVEPASTSTWS
jgi:hypothetical protein